MGIRIIAGCTLLAAVAACAEFPELDRAIPASELSGPYPPLVPVGTLLAQTDEPQIDEDAQARLEARAAALRARANRLKRQ